MKKITIDDTWIVLEGQALSMSGPSYGDYAIALDKNQKVFSLAHIGDWLDPNKFSKCSKVYFKPTYVEEIFNTTTNFLSDLKVAEWNESYVEKVHAFIRYWETDFLKENNSQFWSYLLALYEGFYPKELGELERIYELAIPIYERSFYLAGLSFYSALKNGVYDAKTLREIFLVSLFLDSGLADSTFHYNFYSALELDRTGKEDGAAFLKRMGHSANDVEFYLNHAYVSFAIAKEFLQEHVSNLRLLDLIKIHHEVGPYAFPKGLTRQECDKSEISIVFINQALPFTRTDELDIGTFLKELKKTG